MTYCSLRSVVLEFMMMIIIYGLSLEYTIYPHRFKIEKRFTIACQWCNMPAKHDMKRLIVF